MTPPDTFAQVSLAVITQGVPAHICEQEIQTVKSKKTLLSSRLRPFETLPTGFLRLPLKLGMRCCKIRISSVR